MSRTMRVAEAFAIALALGCGAAHAGGPLAVDAAGNPAVWDRTHPIPYSVDQGSLGSLDNPTAVSLIDEEFGIWSALPSGTLAFQNAGSLPQDVTVGNYGSYLGPYGGNVAPIGHNVVVFDADGSIFNDLFGPGNSVIGFGGPTFFSDGITMSPVGTPSLPAGSRIVEGLLFLNGSLIDGLDQDLPLADFRAAALHEIGHLSGLDHTQAHVWQGDPDDGPLPSNWGWDTMFPIIFSGGGQESLGRDDVVAYSTLYPTAAFHSDFGCVHGSVLASNLSSLSDVNVVARDLDDGGDYISSVTGYGEPVDGGYTICGLTPGRRYGVWVEQIDPLFSGGSSVGINSDPSFLPGPAEWWSGAGENADPIADPPFSRAEFVAVAGATTTGVDVIIDRQAFDVQNFFTDANGTVGLASGDFDGDGKLDFVSVQQTFDPGNRVVFTRSLGNGAFAAPTWMDDFAGNALPLSGQFNTGADAFLDVAVASCTLREVRLYAGRGDGTFSKRTILPGGPVSFTSCFMVAGDVNGDSSLDLVFATAETDGTLTVDTLLGSPTGDFTTLVTHLPATAAIPASGVPAVAAHFGFGPQLDIVFFDTSPTSTELGVLVGDGSGGFTSARIDLSRFGRRVLTALAAGDFDADGNVDLVVATAPNNGQGLRTFIDALRGDGHGGFSPVLGSSIQLLYPSTLTTGDFDSDGRLDVAALAAGGRTETGTAAAILLGDGHGGWSEVKTVWGLPESAGAFGAVSTGDFDGDGKTDLLASGSIASNAAGPYLTVVAQRAWGPRFDAPLSFYTVPPCRILDSRFSGVGLFSDRENDVRAADVCGIPPTAHAISLNLTVTQAGGDGFATLFSGNGEAPAISTINFRAGQTRVNSVVLGLASDRSGTFRARPLITGPNAYAHWIVDVNGYFQ